MDEFGLIDRLFAPLSGSGGLGLLDDAALVPGADGNEIVLAKDLMIVGIHALADQPGDEVAAKLMRVNLSDLAAMGAEPLGYLLGCALPRPIDMDWLSAFAEGLRADQERFGWTLLGGDTTSGAERPVLSLTAVGQVPAGMALRRSGAKPGDAVYVSGVIGDGLLGLEAVMADASARTGPAARYRFPMPRLALGRALRGVASAAIDVSDGLVADAGHIADASGVGIDIEASAVPLSKAGDAAISAAPKRLADLMAGGDDYELVFTVPPAREADAIRAGQNTQTPLRRIGRVTDRCGIRLLDSAGVTLPIDRSGYTHS